MEYVPDIDFDVPLPASATEAMPELSAREELDMRARTVKLLSDLTGDPIEPNEDDRGKALDLARQMMTNPSQSPSLINYSNPTIAYLAGMVAQHDTLVVKELADLKIYIVNKLVAEQSIEEVEKELLETLEKLEKRTVDVQSRVIFDENNA